MNISYFETGCFKQAFIFCLMLYHTLLLFFNSSTFPNFQLFRKLLIFLGDLRDFSSNIVFSAEVWKVSIYLKLYYLTLWKAMLTSAFPNELLL